jgi:NAD(P)-dependent dehydrogenase (short-subunit alcohol dehydrogenase family)
MTNTPAALITGGACRLGKAVALALADDGYDIALHFNTSVKEAEQTAALIRRKGRRCVTFQCDLCDMAAAQELVRAAHRAFPGLSALIHTASVFKPSGLGVDDLPRLDEHMNIHVRCAWVLGAEYAARVKRGSILHFLDTKITADRTAFAGYLLSKKALAELVRMSAADFAPNIRVNAVAPGFILPPKNSKAAFAKSRAAQVPLKRQGRVEHVTEAVRFLLSNDYITGQVIFVDGGEHLARS